MCGLQFLAAGAVPDAGWSDGPDIGLCPAADTDKQQQIIQRECSVGKKSREKKQRREARTSGSPEMLENLLQARRSNSRRDAVEKGFAQHVSAVRTVLERYEPFDATLAIAVSDLWPSNAASPIKHILAWAILSGMPPISKKALRINTYEDFKAFAEALIAEYPDLPMLEDFVPEIDWGNVRVPLRDEYVPMFYGSCIERTPDFVEAFRITHASNQEALADMDLAIAIQSHILRSMPELANLPEVVVTNGHIEVPTAEFWVSCRATLLSAQNELKDWRASSSGRLDARIGAYQAPLGRDAFGNACMQGIALPFVGMVFNDQWIPIGVRSAPGNTIDVWADKGKATPIDLATHWSLAKFVRDRFRRVDPGPLQIWVEDREFDLPVSFVISDNRLWLFVCCSQATVATADRQAHEILSALQPGRKWGFKRARGPHSLIANGDGQSPSAKDVSVLFVLTIAGTAFGLVNAPKKPIRLLPLSDLITIFDAIEDLDELDRFWKYVDATGRSLSPFSRGAADLFASFRDTNEVLVDGAVTPAFIGLDPHWGSSWRYNNLSSFWANAPRFFPDGSTGWHLDKNASGVIEMRSRYDSSCAYSVEVAGCTVQVIMRIDRSLNLIENRMLYLFAQALSDCLQLCGDLVRELALFERQHVVVRCEVDHAHRLDESTLPDAAAPTTPIVTSCSNISDVPLTLGLQVNAVAVQAGLNEATTATFEIESLVETLEAIHRLLGYELIDAVITQVRATATRPARYRLAVVQQSVDALEYVDPIVPKPMDYKLARQHVARSMLKLGFAPGRYELKEAKVQIDAGRDHLRQHIDDVIAKYAPNELARCCIEQHEALLTSERHRVMRVRQSLTHEVDYDRHEAVAEARKEFGAIARHYRYLLEKVLSAPQRTGQQSVDANLLRELVGLVDWFMVLAGASDVLHNGVDVVGVEIDDSYIPEIFYSSDHKAREAVFERQYARSRLGTGVTATDAVKGDLAGALESPELRQAFRKDVGFELKHLLQSLIVLSQPVRHGLVMEPALSHATLDHAIREAILHNIEGVSTEDCEAIIQFLTLSATDIRRLAGRDVDEGDVPFWEHFKRLHRYAIRPLVPDGELLRWGAEQASRALDIWTRSVVDGYLPAEFPWPHVESEVRLIKDRIEKQLEIRTEEIFRRFTPYVMRGVNFFKRFRSEGFADVGDFDVLAYWPTTNTLAAVECKYNKPPFSVKDSRRLRDQSFGKNEADRNGQFSRIAGRRDFMKEHRARMLELLKWPPAAVAEIRYVEMYVSRDEHWWMLHPPYSVPTEFVRVDSLDDWLKSQAWS